MRYEETREIPEYRLDYLRASLERLNRRAAKLGVPGVELSVLRRWIDTRDGRRVEMLEAKVSGPEVKLSGWTLLGCMSNDGLGIARTIPGQEIPEDFCGPEVATRCDHCKTKRDRSKVIFVRNEAGDIKVVGTTCVADFLGGLGGDASFFLALASWFDGFSSSSSDGADFFEGYRPPESFDVLEACQLAAASISRHGFVSRKLQGSTKQPVTADLISYLLGPPPTHPDSLKKWKEDWDHVKALRTEATDSEAAAAVAWVETAEDSGSGYMGTLRKLVSAQVVPFRYMGFVASIVPAYQRAQDRLKKAETFAEANARSRHFGEVKQRLTFTAEVEMVRHFESDYGERIMVKMRTEEGNVVVWFGSADSASADNILEAKGNQKPVTVTATVKEHGEYNGTAQTVVTRPKVA